MENSGGNVRLIRHDELDKLMDLYRFLNPEDPDIKGGALARGLWEELFHDPGMFFLVIEEDGILVSSCTLVVVKNLTRGGRPYGLIENVVTHGNYRNKGYGTSVLQKAVDIASEKGCYKVMLLTGRKEENTLRFYEKAGFARRVKTGFIKKLE